MKADGLVYDNDGMVADVQNFYKFLDITELVFEKPVAKGVQ